MIRVDREVFYVYQDFDNSTIEIGKEDGDVFGYSTISIKKLDEVCEKDCIIFVNSLKILKEFLKGGEIKSKSNLIKKGDIIKYKYKNAEIRSFSMIKPQDVSYNSLIDFFNADSVTHAMYLYIQKLGGPYRMSLTLASYNKKQFYKDLRNVLWQDTKGRKRYINSVVQWKYLYAGCKSGLLSEVWKIKTYHNIASFDLKSAYAAAFVQDDKFPIGKPRFGRKIQRIKECIKEDKWYKIVFTGEIEGLEDFYDTRVDMTAVEYYDVKTLEFYDVDIFKIIEKYFERCTFIWSDDTGYLHKSFRDRVVELYKEKDFYEKGTLERLLCKAPLETLYGKSIQWMDFETDSAVVAHYSGRGENYLLPHMGNHASAYVRYTLAKAIHALKDDCIYWDTDGIKVRKTKKSLKYFENENKIILSKNSRSGYDTNLGTWDLEFDMEKICLIRKKIYAYKEKDSDIVMKCSGMDIHGKTVSLQSAQKKSNGDPFKFWEKNGFYFYPKKVSLYKDFARVTYDEIILPVYTTLEELLNPIRGVTAD